MASCGLKEWQNRVSDAFTHWKDEYAHRVFCDMLGEDCDLHDSPEIISEHQRLLKHKIDMYQREIDVLQRMLNKHQDKWGIKT
jgi:hypothetical protein